MVSNEFFFLYLNALTLTIPYCMLTRGMNRFSPAEYQDFNTDIVLIVLRGGRKECYIYLQNWRVNRNAKCPKMIQKECAFSLLRFIFRGFRVLP